ncbi:MAG: extracellular solute-binding protein [Proteobacteria bacterium]|nr:extracellular solute-binding protein [Pseudomonadota bacterium]MDA1325696.1 extracellular solute-binding protein [Pseudomonadota bacterium]
MFEKQIKYTALKAVAFIPVTAMLAFGTALAADAPKSLEELVAGAKKETTLRGMWSSSSLSGGKGFNHVVAGMNKKYGLNIEPKFTPGPSMTHMIAKVTREAKAGQPSSTDVIWGNAGGALKGGQVGIFRKMNWLAYLDRQPLKWEGFDPIAPGGLSLASAGSLVGIMYNSDLVKGDDIPQSFEDVFKPKFKGKIASTPYAAGMREFGMPDVLGNKAMTEYTKRLTNQIGGLMRCGSADRLTSGEFLMLVFSCGDQYVNRVHNSGSSEPLGYALMKEAVISHTRYGSVPVNSSSPNAAALFVAYLHSVEGQKWMWQENGLDLPVYPESVMRKRLLAAKAKGARIVMNSPQWLGQQGGYVKYRKSLEKILKQKRKKK